MNKKHQTSQTRLVQNFTLAYVLNTNVNALIVTRYRRLWGWHQYKCDKCRPIPNCVCLLWDLCAQHNLRNFSFSLLSFAMQKNPQWELSFSSMNVSFSTNVNITTNKRTYKMHRRFTTTTSIQKKMYILFVYKYIHTILYSILEQCMKWNNNVRYLMYILYMCGCSVNLR